MHESKANRVTFRRPLKLLGMIRKVPLRHPILFSLIAVATAVIIFGPENSPPKPNPGPLPDYVKNLETITIKLPGNVPLEMVRIPAGRFEMGAEHIQYDWWSPVHTVNIKEDFYIGKYEITQGQWLAVMGQWPNKVSMWRRIIAFIKRQQILSEPNPWHGKGPNYPAYLISWNDCQEFIKALNKHIRRTKQGPDNFRLPSEAEWEYACRAGTQTRFFFGDSIGPPYGNHLFVDALAGTLPGKRSDYMKFGASDYPPSEVNREPYGTAQVDKKKPNQFGLYNMHANVTEWCQDTWHNRLHDAPADGSAWEDNESTDRVVRGGNFTLTDDCCWSASRNSDDPNARREIIGFRLARSCQQEHR